MPDEVVVPIMGVHGHRYVPTLSSLDALGSGPNPCVVIMQFLPIWPVPQTKCPVVHWVFGEFWRPLLVSSQS